MQLIGFKHRSTVVFFLSIVLILFCSKPVFAQDKLEGFWSCNIEYQCSWGWKEFRNDVLFSSYSTGIATARVEGGELKVDHFFEGEEYAFEIANERCSKKGKLRHSVFGGVEYLRGEWVTPGDNSAMWGTGLCCNGRIELYRKVKEEKPNGTSLVKGSNNKGQQKLTNKPAAGEKFVLENVIFKLGSSELLPESHPELEKIVKLLEENKKMVVRLEGHTDITGSPKGNMGLSKQRVKAIKRHLTKQGIAGGRIKLKWYGDRRPLLKTGTVEERKINRRVELVVLKTE